MKLFNIKEQPEHVKKQFAFVSSGIITFVIILIWAMTFGDSPKQEQEKTASPLSLFGDTISSISDDIGGMISDGGDVLDEAGDAIEEIGRAREQKNDFMINQGQSTGDKQIEPVENIIDSIEGGLPEDLSELEEYFEIVDTDE